MKYILIKMSLVLIILSSFTSLHKYYVSVTEVTHVAEKNVIQVVSKVFVDDLKQTLEERYRTPVDFYTEEGLVSSSKLIKRYYDSRFQLKINGQTIQLDYLGSEIESGQLVSYLEKTHTKEFSAVEITNKLLFDMFERQQNITHFNNGEVKNSFLSVKGEASKSLNFY